MIFVGNTAWGNGRATKFSQEIVTGLGLKAELKEVCFVFLFCFFCLMMLVHIITIH